MSIWKKVLLVFLGLLLLTASWPVVSRPAAAQELYTYEDYYDNGQIEVRYTYYKDALDNWVRHGICTWWYETGQIEHQLEYIHGEVDGTSTSWYETGQMWIHCEYSYGELHGTYMKWHENGQMMYQWEYKNGELHGTWRYWNADGQIKLKCEYSNAVKHGTSMQWYDNGEMKEQGEYSNGERQGTWTHWYEDGQMSYQQEWENGEFVKGIRYYWYETGQMKEQYEYIISWGKHGTYTYWHENGQMSAQGEYINGKHQGTWTRWYEGGQIKLQCEYIDGIRHGIVTNWYENGQMMSQEEYRDGKRHGIRMTWYENGQMTCQEEWKNDKYHGTSTYWLEAGHLITQWEHRDGKAHGTYTWWCTNGQMSKQEGYRNGIWHGTYTEWYCTGQIHRQGQYSNGNRCSIWRVWREDGSIIYQWDDGPCEALEIDENPYPEIEEDEAGEPQQKEIRGHVHDAKTGEPVGGATIKAGTYQTTSDSIGFYSFILGEEDSYTLTCSKEGFYTYSQDINLADSQYKTVNIKLKEKSFQKPAVTNVKSQYGGIFLQGISASNEYTVSVAWNGEPGTVKFDVNGAVSELAGTASGAKKSFDMGLDFTPSLDPYGNTLKITAVNKAGEESEPEIVHPIVIPVPDWAQYLGVLFNCLPGTNVLAYKLVVQWPQKPVEILISEAKLGILWAAWCLFPLIGCRELGIPPTQAFLEVEAKSDGSGSVACGGQTGFKAAGQEAAGKLGGKGNLLYKPGEGLLWKGADLLIGIEAKLKKDVGPITIIPFLEKAVNLPVVGRAIAWFNNKAKIVGRIIGAFELAIQIISEKGELGFHKADGQIKSGIEAGLTLDITEKLKAELLAGGTNIAHWQVPAAPDYLKKVDAELFAKLVLQFWLYTHEYTATHTFTYQEGAGKVILVESNPGEGFHPVSRDFLNYAPYSHFVANSMGSTRAFGAAEAASEQKIIENVYPYSEPALAEDGGDVAIAFVYFDPADPTLQATEIYFTYYDGAGYTDPSPVLDDTRAEFAPTIAFDQNGKVVGVWERVKDDSFSSNVTADMAKEMEIVYAVYDPSAGNWTEPVSLTDNDYLDFSPVLRMGQDDTLLLIWQSNEGNEIIGSAAHPATIHYALWDADGEDFGTAGTVAEDFEDCFKFSLAHHGEEAILSYTRDMDGNFTAPQDEEIFYTSFDGTSWSAPARVTDDEEADINPEVIYRNDGSPELMWLKGSNLVRLTNWDTGDYEIIREESESITFTDFKVVCDPQNHLVLLWQDADDEGVDLFYSVYDPDNEVWSKDLRLTEDEAMEKGFNGVFSSDGVLHLVYNKVNLETEANDLYHLTYELGADLAVSSEGMSVEPENPSPGTEAVLNCTVENKGDLALNDVPVAFYLGDPDDSGEFIGTANVEPTLLRAGDEGKAILSWNITEDIEVYTVYAIVDPEDNISEINESNNSAYFLLIKPDLEALQCRVEEHGDGSVDIIAVIQNSGVVPATDVEVLYKAEGDDLGVITIPSILAGQQAEVTYTVWAGADFTGLEPEIEVEVDPEDKIVETNEDNNQAFALLLALRHISVSTTSHDFGEVIMGNSSIPLVITIYNTGGAAFNISSLAMSDTTNFSLNTTGGVDPLGEPPAVVPARESHTVAVTFSPSSAGAYNATLAIESDDPSAPSVSVLLTGTGAAIPQPGISATPTSYNFGDVTLGSSSTPLVMIIRNTGGAALSISSMTLLDTTNFSLNVTGGSDPLGDPPATIPARGSRTVVFTFSPSSEGAHNATLTVDSDDLGTPSVSVSLTGTGGALPEPNIITAPAYYNFGDMTVGSSSEPLVIGICNTGGIALNISGVTLSDTTNFSLNVTGGSNPLGNPPTTIPAGGGHTVTVTFSPSSTGTCNATLTIESDAPDTPSMSVSLTGTGLGLTEPDISVTPTSHDFGSVNVGSISSPQAFTISNEGDADLVIDPLSITGTDASEFSIQNDNCSGQTIAPSESCKVDVVFSPASEGTKNANLSIQSNDPEGTVDVALSGTGVPAMPDLVIIEKSEEWVSLVEKSYNITYTVCNEGSAAAAASNTTISIDEVEILEDPVPALAAGDCYTNTVGPYTMSGNSDTVEVCADNEDVVAESDEDNNCLQNEFITATLMEGDATLNDCVSISDAMFIAQYKAGLRAFDTDQLTCTDTSDDGNVSMVDAMHIAQWLVDPEGTLGVLFKPLWESPADDAMLHPVHC